MRFSDLSYRYKVPLSLSLAILVSGFVLTLILLVQAERDLRAELFDHAADLGAVLTPALITAIKHDDVWQAYRTLSALDSGSASDRLLVVLDREGAVYVSNQPKRLPILSKPQQSSQEFGAVAAAIEERNGLAPFVVEGANYEFYYTVHPLLVDRVKVADLIIGYSRARFLPRLYGIYWHVTLTSLAVIVVLMPVGWRLGHKMARPLVRLSNSMAQVGHRPSDQVQCEVYDGHDEIGQLNEQFHRMLAELIEKERLVVQMIASERLAAVGQLSAGIAHEINNPLGGMLNTVRTLKKFGDDDPMMRKTADLLERGMLQIQEIVSALLVEARGRSHPLSKADINDVRTLLESDAQRKGVTLEWQVALDHSIAIPSTPVRQILMNLVLNGIQAASVDTRVECKVTVVQGCLHIQVTNQGQVLSQRQLGHLFEPFMEGRPEGTGLGLWVTYQVVQQVAGEIEVESEQGRTRFEVTIPVREAA